MGVFEYLGVILSVIMGLGVTHILAGLSKTIHHRKTVTTYWVQALWAINVLIYIVTIWWGMFWWSGQQEWSYFQFMLLILYAILLFLAASLIFPWDFADDFDFRKHFYDTRPWFFAVLALAWTVDIPETVAKSDVGLRGLPDAYSAFVIPHIALNVIAASWSNESYHRFYAVFWPFFTVGYLAVTTLTEIAT
ncbi:MAG: hypothetical protein R3192_13010 [Woeseiaceae bacterium]|nr:hypothetical protein [Woeseiaceae bacterium]